MRPQILALLGPYPAWRNYDDEYIEALQPFLYGYSMYEVDGVFKGSAANGGAIIEERTQVLRLLFRIDLDAVAKEAEAEALDKKVLRAIVCDYLRAHNRQVTFETSAGESQRIIAAAKKWRDQLGFFVFGYIVYELGRHIELLRTSGSIGKTEDEIWVVNFCNMELDRVLWRSNVG